MGRCKADQRPDETLAALRRALSAELPGLPVIRARRVSRQVQQVLVPQHLGAILFGVFGAFAALLAATGVAGVTIFELRRRRREMGIRHALGAGRLRSAAPVLRGTMVATGVGFVSGWLVVTGIGGRWLESTNPWRCVRQLGIHMFTSRNHTPEVPS